jgi:hypothetical protein
MTVTSKNEMGNHFRASSRSQSRNVMTCKHREGGQRRGRVLHASDCCAYAETLRDDNAGHADHRLDRQKKEVHVELGPRDDVF